LQLTFSSGAAPGDECCHSFGGPKRGDGAPTTSNFKIHEVSFKEAQMFKRILVPTDFSRLPSIL